MRAYWNNTDQPITYKVWTCSIDTVTKNQLGFLKGYGITARCVLDQESFESNGQRYYYGSNGRAEFETTTPEQESMLKLTYGDKLILVTVNVVTPYSMLESTV